MFKEGAESDGKADGLDQYPDPGLSDETKVRLDAADDDDDEGPEPEEKLDENNQPRKKDGTWASKKAARAKERREGRASWEAERADNERRFRQQQEEHDRTVRSLRDDVDRLTRRIEQGNTPPQDEFTSKIAEVRKNIASELKRIETDDNTSYDRYNELREQEAELIAQRTWARKEAERQQNQPRPSPYDARRPFIESEYPWVTDVRYRDLAIKAQSYKQYLVNFEGRPDTLDTDREALATVQSRFGADYGMAPPPAPPSRRQREMYAGPGTRHAPRQERSLPREVNLGEMGRGTGLSEKTLAAILRSTMEDEGV
jgi:hypothetical protein